MIITNLKGGLGNQMFQYSIGRSLSLKCQTELKFDTSFLSDLGNKEVTLRNYELSIFKLQESFASKEEIHELKNFQNRLLRKYFYSIQRNPYRKERFFQFDPEILKESSQVYLDGHWITERYFKSEEQKIRQDFSFKVNVIEKARTLESSILNSNAIAIQVRRGDYVTKPNVTSVHGVTSLNFFRTAVNYIQERVENAVFYIFSDDIEWCIENFSDLGSVFFVEQILKESSAGNSDYLQLMSLCKHFIISNSTYGWWGAWLGSYANKIVIAPKTWLLSESINTTDVYPDTWIKL